MTTTTTTTTTRTNDDNDDIDEKKNTLIHHKHHFTTLRRRRRRRSSSRTPNNPILLSQSSIIINVTMIIVIFLHLLTICHSFAIINPSIYKPKSLHFTTTTTTLPFSIRQLNHNNNNNNYYFHNPHHHHRHHLPSSSLLSSTTTTTTIDEWTPHNVTDDLINLRQSLSQSNAVENLKKDFNRRLLDTMARGRRSVKDDLSFGLRRLSLMMIGIGLVRRLLGRRRWSVVVVVVLKGLMDGLWWMTCVVTPLVLWRSMVRDQKKQRRRRTMEMRGRQSFSSLRSPPPGMEFISPSYRRIDTPNDDCDAPLLQLVEYWQTVSLPYALFSIVRFIHNRRGLKCIPHFVSGSLGLLARTSLILSIHQYVPNLYNLRRDHRPRPLTRHGTYLKQLTAVMMSLSPWMILLDVCRLCDTLRLTPNRASFPYRSPLLLASSSLTLLSSLSHIIAYARIIRIRYTSSSSLSHTHSPPPDDFRWRWYLSWRTPTQSVSQILKRWWLFFVTGYESPEDKWLFANDLRLFRNEEEEEDKEGVLSSSMEDSKSLILRLLQAEQKQKEERQQQQQKHDGNNNYEEGRLSSFSKREEWVRLAEERMRRNHEVNYENDLFPDPLGMAVQKTFNLGLSFDYDHTTTPPSIISPSPPSIYRLRARFAKSAIKRIRTLLDPQRAQSILDDTPDDQKRNRAKELQQEATDETEYLKQQLWDLIPTFPGVMPEGVEELMDLRTIRESDLVKEEGSVWSKINDPERLVAREGERVDYGRELAEREFGRDVVEEMEGGGERGMERRKGGLVEERFIRMEYDDEDEEEEESE